MSAPAPSFSPPPVADLSEAKFVERANQRRVEAAERETARAEEEGRLPANTAVTNPAPTNKMDGASGAFIEDEIREGVPFDHPSVDNNPRRGTSAVQNGQDFNDPHRRNPLDPEFAGQGLDLSVYGGEVAKK
jgi:hypothetical protein